MDEGNHEYNPYGKTEKDRNNNYRQLSSGFLDEIIMSTAQDPEHSYVYTIYDKELGWYSYVDINNPKQRNRLRTKISQLMRDERKRLLKMEKNLTAMTQATTNAQATSSTNPSKRGFSGAFATTNATASLDDNTLVSSNKDKSARYDGTSIQNYDSDDSKRIKSSSMFTFGDDTTSSNCWNFRDCGNI